MEIIVSHDVDHLLLWEHWKDRFYPGLLYKGFRGVIEQKVKFSEFLKRATTFHLENIEALHHFNKKHGVRETFFFGMSNALGLSYASKSTIPFIDYLIKEGVDIGVHGIAYKDEAYMAMEMQRFRDISQLNSFGIRNHYLRSSPHTFKIQEHLGYEFDSTKTGLKNPYKIGNMWEFPISIMDSQVLSPLGGKLEYAKRESLRRIEEAQQKDLKYFTINFHDVYFSHAYSEYLEWYTWIICYLKDKGFNFTSFKKAIDILEK